MAQRPIREYDGKRMIARLLAGFADKGISVVDRYVQVRPDTDLDKLPKQHAWLTKERLVAKPDQLIKRRGKANLILLDACWKDAKAWIKTRRGKKHTVEGVSDTLDYFLVEPYIPHEREDEYYLAIRSRREADEILFYHQGGVDVGDVEAKAKRITVPVKTSHDHSRITVKPLLSGIPERKSGFLDHHKRNKLLEGFIKAIYNVYASAGFVYLEINPLVIAGGKIKPLDLAAKLDDTAAFENVANWNGVEFPPPWGYSIGAEEQYIADLDEKTGASLKLTVLNPEGRVWTMVAGGGASVIYADTVGDLGYGKELANYGEYSGNPSEEHTYQYAKTILDLMTRKKHPKGKFLIIGGGIANFTDVAKTFKGIIRALADYQEKLRAHKVKVLVRRGGPNYREGLTLMRELGESIGIPIEVYGPETHMTRVVSLALGGKR